MGKRIATALVLIPFVLLAVLFLAPRWFATLIGCVALLGAWEWAGLAGLATAQRVIYSLGLAVVLALAYWLLMERAGSWLLVAAMIWWLLATISLSIPITGRLWRIASGIVTLLFGWYGLVWLRHTEHGVALVVFLFALVWIADSAAYFTGRQFGRRKLAPRLSPGKTVEGVLGGMLGATVFTIIAGALFLPEPGIVQLGLVSGLGIVVVAVSIIGDLFESQLKRSAGVKDSGHWLPGHGGVLDRIDSMLAAAPAFAAGVMAVSFEAG